MTRSVKVAMRRNMVIRSASRLRHGRPVANDSPCFKGVLVYSAASTIPDACRFIADLQATATSKKN